MTRYSKKSSRNIGFTLLELLVGLSIALVILSAIYGAYSATSQSTGRWQKRATSSRQSQLLLNSVARQLRCLYNDFSSERPEDRFCGGATADSGMMSFLTTSPLLSSDDKGDGIYRIAYRLDRAGRLCYRQSPHISAEQRGRWLPIAENIGSIDIEFFDGSAWLARWPGQDKKSPPNAVRIKLTQGEEVFQTVVLTGGRPKI